MVSSRGGRTPGGVFDWTTTEAGSPKREGGSLVFTTRTSEGEESVNVKRLHFQGNLLETFILEGKVSPFTGRD